MWRKTAFASRSRQAVRSSRAGLTASHYTWPLALPSQSSAVGASFCPSPRSTRRPPASTPSICPPPSWSQLRHSTSPPSSSDRLFHLPLSRVWDLARMREERGHEKQDILSDEKGTKIALSVFRRFVCTERAALMLGDITRRTFLSVSLEPDCRLTLEARPSDLPLSHFTLSIIRALARSESTREIMPNYQICTNLL